MVAGIRNTLSLDDFAELDQKSHDELMAIMEKLESHYKDLCDIEFTVERGKLWMLQTRIGKRRRRPPSASPSTWSTRASSTWTQP